MLIEGDECGGATVRPGALAPAAIPCGFDLIGFEFPLVREVRVPAAGVVYGARDSDVFGDDGGWCGAFQFDAKNLAVAAPEVLDKLRDFHGGGFGGGAD